MTKPSKAKARGAQPANTNAQSSGFYSDQFSPDELALIASFTNDPTVDDELWMQRVLNRRLLGFINQTPGQGEPLSLETVVRVAEALAIGTGRVARLLRDKRALSGAAADGIAGAVSAALDEFATELGIEL